jgi:hypothetical protein
MPSPQRAGLSWARWEECQRERLKIHYQIMREEAASSKTPPRFSRPAHDARSSIKPHEISLASANAAAPASPPITMVWIALRSGPVPV